MANEIYGPYHSKEEVIKAVDIMTLKGFKAENITILANKRLSSKLENQTDANVESSEADESETSILNRIKGLFKDEEESEPTFSERLTALGMSEAQAEKYVEGIESGQILVIANDELRLGHDASNDRISGQDSGPLEESVYLEND
ncbi:general stress protein [Virgibacillus siamensis]|uniref:general stress protein n=1 Tax=Virgibacillus siamensis TaxID=480071 RepID=UPI000986D9A7|nr:general stress protein [Virgibacillus siamensis]